MFDMIVLGGGPGGYTAAIRAAHQGGKVALIERDALGGTCLNWGCIPTKALVKSAEVYRSVRDAEQFGVNVENSNLNFSGVTMHKTKVVNDLRKGLDQLMKANKIEVFSGSGEVQDLHTILVDQGNGEKTAVKGKNIVIATGSVPIRIPIPGADAEGVITSDQALSLTSLPDSMVVIGGGVVGLELASVFNSFGCKITVVEMAPFILPPMDQEISRRLTPMLKKQGMNIFTGTVVKEIKRQDKLVVTLEGKQDRQITADMVLLATGRVPNLAGVSIDKLGIHHQGQRIAANERMETNLPGIYAVGDVTGGTMLAHVAAAEGMVAADNCMGQQREFDFRAVPACIFTYPEVAAVGMTEQQAKDAYTNITVSKFPFSASGKALTLGEGAGITKMIAHAETGQILGVHILGAQATELIAEAALAIDARLTAQEVADTIHAHPTLAETIAEAAHGIVGKSIHTVR